MLAIPNFKPDANILVDLIENILKVLPDSSKRIIAVGAIPHWFNNEYLIWMLPGNSKEMEESVSSLRESISFLTEHQFLRYTYHEDVRYAILLNWTRLFPNYDFIKLTSKAKDYFNEFISSKDAEEKLDHLIESYYLELMTNTSIGFISLSDVFINSLNLSMFENCDAILKILREPQINLTHSQENWTSYFRASLLFASGKFLQAKQILDGLVVYPADDQNIRLLALSKRDLAIVTKYMTNEWDSVIQLLNESLVLFEKISDWEGYGSASLQISIILREQGKPSWDQAKQFAEIAIDAFERANQKHGVAKAQVELGLLYWLNNDFEHAGELYKRALSFQESQKNKMEVARVQAFLGRLYRTQGNWDDSEMAFLRSLEILETTGNKHEEAWTLNALGNLYTDMGNFSKAETMLTKSEEIRSVLGQDYEKAVILKNLITVYGELAQLAKAESAINDSLKIFEGLGATQRIGEVLLNAGDVYFNQSDLSKALDFYTKAMTIVEQFDYKDYLPHLKVNIGKILFDQKNNELASKFLKDGLVISLKKNYRKWASEASFMLGILAKENKEIRVSLSSFSNAFRYAKDFNLIYAQQLIYNISAQLSDMDALDEQVALLQKEINEWLQKRNEADN